jgi:hypothetical protein
MKKRTRLLIGIGISAILIAHYFWLMWLFPNATFALIGVFPVVMIINLGAIGGIYAILGMIKQKSLMIVICLIVLVVVPLLQIVIHPINGGVFKLSHEYWNAFWEYPNKITYNDLAFGNEAEMTAAILKYKENLPDIISGIEIYKNERNILDNPDKLVKLESFTIEKRKEVVVYDEQRLKVEENENGTRFILRPLSDNTQEYELNVSMDIILFPYSGGSIPSKNGYQLEYSTSEIHKEPYAGIDKVFAFMVTHFR